MLDKSKNTSYWAISVFSIVLLAIAYALLRSNFYLFYAMYVVLFLLWIGLQKSVLSFKTSVVFGLVLRISLVFATPELSDDFYRFLWDGKLLVEGLNPFVFTPTEVAQYRLIDGEFVALYPHLNSPDYYTVYPTIVQGINFLSVFIGRTVFGAMIVMKTITLLFECLSLYFLTKLLPESHKRQALWYWLCPLVLLEFVGNLHHEYLVICFMLGTYYFLKKEKHIFSAIFFALAVFSKLNPLLFLPFIIIVLPASKRLDYLIYFSIAAVLLLVPMTLQNGLQYFGKSVQLYFGDFEFNSSLYQLTLPITWAWEEFRFVYKGIVLLLMGAYFYHWHQKSKDLIHSMIGIYLIYLLTAQSIHPWYILPLLPFMILNEKPSYYFVWLLLIPLTYSTYLDLPYKQMLWVNILEYSMLMLFFFKNEYFKNRLSKWIS